jgi:hypothetical protein
MTPDEATVELYKYIYENEHNTTLEDVQRYVEAGARLRDIETLYGPPLLLALYSKCRIPILKYLIEKGGIDWSYKKGKYMFYSEMEPAITLISITYNTFMNELIHTWHFCKGGRKADNQELMNIYRAKKVPKEECKNIVFRYPYEVDEYYNDEDFCKELNQMYEARCNRIRKQYGGEEYARQVCELFGVTPEELEDGILELPEKYYDISLLPKEDKPYCWNMHINEPFGRPYDNIFIFYDVEDEGEKQSDEEK